MGRRWIRSAVLLTLVAAAIGLVAAARFASEEAAFREVDALADKSQWPEAIAAAEAALQQFPNSDHDAMWALRVEYARALAGRGRHDRAVEILSGDIPKRLARSETALEWRNVQALATARVGRYDEALRWYAAAEKLAVVHPSRRVDVLRVRGTIAAVARKPGEGIAPVRTAIRLAREAKQRDPEMRARGQLVQLLCLAGRFDEAVSESRRATALAKELGASALLGKMQGNLGWAYLELGDHDAAEPLFVAAEQSAASLGAEYDRVVWLDHLANVYLRRGDFTRADDAYRRALGIARRTSHHETGTILANLARLSIERRDFDAARRYNAEALEIKRARKRGRATEVRSLLIDATIAAEADEVARAETLLKSVLADAQAVSHRWEAHARLGQLYARTKKPALADEQFRLALDIAAAAREDVEEEELRLSFGATVAQFYESYVEFLVAGGRHREAFHVVESSRARTLAEGLGITGDKEHATVDPQRVAKEHGAAILSYWLATPRSFVWVATPTSLQVFALPAEAQLARDVDAYQRELVGPRGTLAMSGARGEQLWRTLVEPASRAIGDAQRVIVLPDGRLDSFNLETLVVPSPRRRYWLEDVVVLTAPSLHLLAHREETASGKRSLLLVGNPPTADPAYPALRNAAAEIRNVQRHFAGDTRVLEGAKATPRAYEQSAPGQYAFVHFVAHGVAVRNRPLDSAIVLARDGESYKLYARDIVRHPLNARLVTISSCHGAGVRAYTGEGLVGLAWAFLRAGSQQVVAALWEVNDNATPRLMDRMYDGIRKGRDPATALRDAKLELVRTNGVYAKPLYWAPFVIYSGA